MKRKPFIFNIVIIILFSVLFSSCIFNKNIIKNATEIVYHFNDSSVPPKYHRSYTIKINNNSISLTVDSYGDILVDTTFVISQKEFNNLIDLAVKYQLSNRSKKTTIDDCSGGTSKSIDIYKNNNIILSGTCYKCGGQTYGDLKGDIDSYSKFISSLIPNFSDFLQ